MNDILKQRLVGALILVALGVVFWPIIFVEPGAVGDPQHSRIPPRPEVDTTPIERPRQDGWRASTETYEEEETDSVIDDATLVLEEPTESEDTQALSDKLSATATATATAPAPAVRSSAPETPALDGNGVPIAWSIQVASVSSSAKAEALRDQLLAMHEKAYIRKLERGDKDLYRVYVGPQFERAQLERMQAGIDSRFGVKSLLVRYLP